MTSAFLTILFFASIFACDQKTIESEIEEKEIMKNKNIQLVHQYFEHFNNHDWSKMADMYIDKAQFKDPTLGKTVVTQTREEIINKYNELNTIFPDIHDEIINIYPSGDEFVIVEFISSGSAMDDSKFELPICTIFAFKDGLITKDFSYFDNFEE